MDVYSLCFDEHLFKIIIIKTRYVVWSYLLWCNGYHIGLSIRRSEQLSVGPSLLNFFGGKVRSPTEN